MNIAILQYNNYFNRTIRKAGETAEEYFEAAYVYKTFGTGINLKPNDEIYTKIKLNDLDFHPDYLINYDDEGRIISRWFVIEVVFIMGHQYDLTIRRDVIADNIAAIKSAKAVIERGSLYGDSPLLFNNENFSFNQIKRGEVLLKDESDTPWIVGYIASNYPGGSEITASSESATSYPTVESLHLIFNDDADPSKGARMDFMSNSYALCPVITDTLFGIKDGQVIKSSLSSIAYTVEGTGNRGIEDDEWAMQLYPFSESQYNLFKSVYGNYSYDNHNTINSQILSAYGYASASDRDNLTALNGQVVHSTVTGKYYQLTIVSQTSVYEVKRTTANDNAALYQSLKNIIILASGEAGSNFTYLDPAAYLLGVDISRISISLVEVASNSQIKVEIPATRNKLIDGPYDMFAMPYNTDTLALAQAIKISLSTNVYDIQILPYCPYREFVDDLSGGTLDVDYAEIKQYDEDTESWVEFSYMLFPKSCSASFSIHERLAADAFMGETVIPNNAIKTKILNETQSFRLVAPNYNAAFELSIMKNSGVVDYWRVDFTYRPVSPYIHVAPMFNGMYGTYNNDARGLILAGDFSIDAVSNEWITYQIQNKNYRNIFNTQIKTMDQLHELEVLQKGLTTAAGSVVSGVASGVASGNVGVGIGTAAMTAGAGIFDIAMNQERFNINRRQALETFSYQLGNIKALPNTLTQISAYNVNNKYFPLVEVYGATDQEIEAFKEFLDLRGFSVGVCGTLWDYVNYYNSQKPFLKARIIRMDDFLGDSHMAEEIYKEFEEGVYLNEI